MHLPGLPERAQETKWLTLTIQVATIGAVMPNNSVTAWMRAIGRRGGQAKSPEKVKAALQNVRKAQAARRRNIELRKTRDQILEQERQSS